ncbi:MAG: hypothetical protein AAF511_11960 [Pseudomonadota bacterium]
MTINLKKWAGLGLGTAALSASLAACGSEEGEAHHDHDHGAAEHAHAGEMGEDSHDHSGGEQGEAASAGGESGEGEGGEGEGGEGEGGEAGYAPETLEVPERLAFMSGHVEAGLALYRAGEASMAAPHLLHPVSETHEAEREGLDALGFQPSVFEAVSKALEDGLPAEDIEPQLAAAEANLAQMAAQAGGDPVATISFLMDTIVEEYTVAITDGAISDPGEYQDAYGFAIVARQRAVALDPTADDLIAEIDTLIALWSEGPVPVDDPAPVGQVTAQTSRVALALPQ